MKKPATFRQAFQEKDQKDPPAYQKLPAAWQAYCDVYGQLQ